MRAPLWFFVAACKAPPTTPPAPTDTGPTETADTADTDAPQPSNWTAHIDYGRGFARQILVVDHAYPIVILAVAREGWTNGDRMAQGSASIHRFDLETSGLDRLHVAINSYPVHLTVSAPGDLDGDGHLDAIIGQSPPVLVRGPFNSNPPRTLELDYSGLYYRPAHPCDVDGDGQADLCFADGVDRGPVDGTLDLAWEPNLPFGVSPALVAVLRRPEGPVGALAIPSMLGRIDYSATGTVDLSNAQGWAWPPGFQELNAAAAWDPDGDGVDDLLVCATQDGVPGLRVIDDFAAYPPVLTTLEYPCDALVVADFTGDGTPEVAIGGGSRVRIVDPDGWTLLAEWIGEERPGADDLGKGLDARDVDGDGRADLFAGAPATGNLYVTTEAVPR